MVEDTSTVDGLVSIIDTFFVGTKHKIVSSNLNGFPTIEIHSRPEVWGYERKLRVIFQGLSEEHLMVSLRGCLDLMTYLE